MQDFNEPTSSQLADDFAAHAVETVLKKDLPGLVILDGLARGARPIEQPKPTMPQSSENNER